MTLPNSVQPLAQQMTHPRARAERALVARVGREYFAFPLAAVREALDTPRIVPLPLMPAGVLGQATHRSHLVPVIDPQAVLGAAREATGLMQGTLLVMAGRAVPYALAVDDVLDVIEIAEGERRALPPGTDRAGMLTGLVEMGNALVSAVDMAALDAAAGSLLGSLITTGTR